MVQPCGTGDDFRRCQACSVDSVPGLPKEKETECRWEDRKWQGNGKGSELEEGQGCIQSFEGRPPLEWGGLRLNGGAPPPPHLLTQHSMAPPPAQQSNPNCRLQRFCNRFPNRFLNRFPNRNPAGFRSACRSDLPLLQAQTCSGGRIKNSSASVAPSCERHAQATLQAPDPWVLFPQLLEPCRILPFINTPPCRTTMCCFRHILGVRCCSRKGGGGYRKRQAESLVADTETVQW